MGFADFTKLSFALSSFAQPFDQTGSIPEYVFVILPAQSLHRTFSKRNRWKKNRSNNKMAARKLLFTRLEIVFVTISPFTKRMKVVPNMFQEGKCCLEGLINLACGLQLQMLSRLNGHFINVLVLFCT